MNQITLTGAVATEPRLRPGFSPQTLAFRLLVPRDHDAAEPLYVDVVCSGHLADFADALELAGHVAVAGSLDHHEWVAFDGYRRARWVVVAGELVVLRAAKRAA